VKSRRRSKLEQLDTAGGNDIIYGLQITAFGKPRLFPGHYQGPNISYVRWEQWEATEKAPFQS
jgi:hypothetical protein